MYHRINEAIRKPYHEWSKGWVFRYMIFSSVARLIVIVGMIGVYLGLTWCWENGINTSHFLISGLLGIALLLIVSFLLEGIFNNKFGRALQKYIDDERKSHKIIINGYITPDDMQIDAMQIDYRDVLVDEENNAILLHTWNNARYEEDENKPKNLYEELVQNYYQRFGGSTEWPK